MMRRCAGSSAGRWLTGKVTSPDPNKHGFRSPAQACTDNHVTQRRFVRRKCTVVLDQAGNVVKSIVPVEPADQIERRIDCQADASPGDDAGVNDGSRPRHAAARKIIQEIERGGFFGPDGASARSGRPALKYAGGR